MIGRTHRFHGRASIRRLYTGGKAARTAMLALRYAPTSRREGYRVGVVVSRKVSKSAVVRNRIRRRIYERVRILYNGAMGDYDLLITVYEEKAAAMPPAELEREVAKLLTKARIISTPDGSRAIVEP